MQNFIWRVPSLNSEVPRTFSKKVNFCMFLGLSYRKFRVLVHPARIGTKGANLRGISNTNLPFLVNQSFMVQKQNYKLVSRKLTKRQVEAIQTCLPLLLRHPNQASTNFMYYTLKIEVSASVAAISTARARHIAAHCGTLQHN